MRLRILHVTPYSETAWAYGGIPRVVGALTRGLARRGHSVTVCATDVHGESTRLPMARPARRGLPNSSGGITQHIFPNLSNRLAYHQQVFLPVGLREYMRQHATEFDVAHLHACRNLPCALASHYLRRAGVPYVVQPNGTAPVIERHQLAKHMFDFVAGRRVMAGADRVLAVSLAERHQLADLGVSEASVRVIGNPIDLGEFSTPIPRGRFRRHWELGDDPIVLFLGKITPRKNVDTLVRSFAQLGNPRTRLVVAGNDMGGGQRAQTLAHELGVGARALFTGLLTGAARLEALADADVVVYASQHEIFGLVPFEAILAGTPVVVADDSGCGDLVGATGGGAVVPVNNTEALALAIDDVLNRPDFWQISVQRANKHVRALYGDDVVCGALEDVYDELLSARQVGRDALKGIPHRMLSDRKLSA
jgi:glycosyltransferase involved in cell wall biosynthesis